MQSRLLTNLQTEASNTNDAQTWARAMCRAAAHLGRQGHVNDALASIALVRSRFDHDLTPRVAAWLMLAEGILEFYRDKADAAFDRMRRAHAIALAARLPDVQPTCAAWLALVHFNAARHDAMLAHLDEALGLARPDDHQALARAGLVLADALHFSGSFLLSRPWYDLTRQHATAEGDEATLSAMLYNVAVCRACRVRLADVHGGSMPEETRRALMEANSVLHYDTAIGTMSLTMQVPLLRAQLLLVDKQYAQAEAMLESIDRDALGAQSIPLLLVDLAWCKVAQGRHSEGAVLAEQARALLPTLVQIDDAGYLHARLSSVAAALEQAEQAAAHRMQADQALTAHQATLTALLARLQDLVQRHHALCA